MKIVLTGGPHSGKTTLLAELGARGYPTVPEAAIGIIDELVAELGTEGAREWRRGHVPEFQERIAHRQLELEHLGRGAGNATCFCDRGLVDGLAYLRLAGVEPPGFLLEAVQRSRYDAVVLCDICLPFKTREQTGRTSSLERAREIEARLVACYVELGYAPLRLPAIAPVQARADLLLERLALPPRRP